MHALVLTACLLSGATPLEDGTVIYLENSNPVVERYTGSSVTHVAIAINIGDQPWVYEATPNEVRRLPLSEYRHEIGELNQGRRKKVGLTCMRPKQVYSAAEVAAMRAYLDSQLGRRYSVKGYVRQKQGDGIHCAELLANTLTRGGHLTFEQAFRMSPHEVVERATQAYGAPAALSAAPVTPRDTWCARSWRWWSGTFEWCGWAAVEAWTFCW